MTRRRQLLVLLLFLAVGGTAREVRSELLGPGPYHGFFTMTRWGQKVFHSGPYHLFVSDAAARVLEEYRGKPLELRVDRFSRLTTSEAGLIEEIAQVSETSTARGLVLSAKLKSKVVPQGQGILLYLSLRNDSEEPITIWPRTLAIALATDSPFSNEDIGYKDGRAFWYYS